MYKRQEEGFVKMLRSQTKTLRVAENSAEALSATSQQMAASSEQVAAAMRLSLIHIFLRQAITALRAARARHIPRIAQRGNKLLQIMLRNPLIGGDALQRNRPLAIPCLLYTSRCV